MATHYDRLGVAPSASTEEIRRAYRSLAQRLHPDRQAEASPAERRLAERRMREINEAWDVLRDPARRRSYDQQRLGGPGGGRGSGSARRRPASPPVASATGPTVGPDDDLVDVAPEVSGLVGALVRHLPWVVLLVVFAAIFVFSAYAAHPGSGTVGSTTVTVGAGTCLDVASGPTTSVVPCSGPHDVRVLARVVDPASCPPGAEPRRLGTDGLVDCVTSS